MNEDQNALMRFQGTTRLFPLPSLVFFPNALQPLHVFEQRYRDMMADAIEDDLLLSLVLLKPGWDQDYDGAPAIEPVACLGRITDYQELPDGRYNLLLKGLKRIRVLEELSTDKLYRQARAEVLDNHISCNLAMQRHLQNQLASAVLPRLEHLPDVHTHIAEMFDSSICLGDLCDVLSFMLPLPLERKQALLETPHVEERTRQLIEILKPRTTRPFPPDFSLN